MRTSARGSVSRSRRRNPLPVRRRHLGRAEGQDGVGSAGHGQVPEGAAIAGEIAHFDEDEERRIAGRVVAAEVDLLGVTREPPVGGGRDLAAGAIETGRVEVEVDAGRDRERDPDLERGVRGQVVLGDAEQVPLLVVRAGGQNRRSGVSGELPEVRGREAGRVVVEDEALVDLAVAVFVGGVAGAELGRGSGRVRAQERPGGAGEGALQAEVAVAGAVAAGAEQRILDAVRRGDVAVVVDAVADLEGGGIHRRVVVVAVEEIGDVTGRELTVDRGLILVAEEVEIAVGSAARIRGHAPQRALAGLEVVAVDGIEPESAGREGRQPALGTRRCAETEGGDNEPADPQPPTLGAEEHGCTSAG